MGGGCRRTIRTIARAAVLTAASVLPGGGVALGQCEIQELQSPWPGVGNLFGVVSISGDLAAIGDPTASGFLGAVYVYRRDGAEWLHEATLTSPEPDPEEYFGFPAIDGNVIVVGAYGAAAPEFQSGAAYVYRCTGGDWAFEQRLTASDGDMNDIFGFSVAIDGDVILIGARDDENAGLMQSGSAYVFRYDGIEWIEEAKLTDPGAEAGDLMGQSVAVRGDVALIAAHGNDDAGPLTGAAFVFRFDGERWQLGQQLTPPSVSGAVYFGWSVALADDVALIGGPEEDGQNGAAFVFNRVEGLWQDQAILRASDPAGPSPLLGRSVSISADGERCVIGAPYDWALGWESGAAHVFRREGADWTEVMKLTASNGTSSDAFGSRIAIQDDTALISAPGQGAQPGSVYIIAGISGIDCNYNGVSDACDIFAGTSPDLNGNGVPDECEAIGDLNGDGVVNVLDLLALLAAWGPCDAPCPPSCTGDVSGDCIVDGADLQMLLENWGERR